jgi:hypothetical protein
MTLDEGQLRSVTPTVPLEFRDPEDVTGLDDLDTAELLWEDWLRQTTEYDDYDEGRRGRPGR